jgi:hypothetical protein
VINYQGRLIHPVLRLVPSHAVLFAPVRIAYVCNVKKGDFRFRIKHPLLPCWVKYADQSVSGGIHPACQNVLRWWPPSDSSDAEMNTAMRFSCGGGPQNNERTSDAASSVLLFLERPRTQPNSASGIPSHHLFHFGHRTSGIGFEPSPRRNSGRSPVRVKKYNRAISPVILNALCLEPRIPSAPRGTIHG